MRSTLSLSPERQLSQYAISTWQTADGLPMNSVLAMAQAADGSLWIGTEEGLVRFDGAEFEVRDRGNTPSMDAHNVQALCAEEDGTVWAGTYGAGLLRWDGRAFSRLAAESEPERSRPVRALARGADGCQVLRREQADAGARRGSDVLFDLFQRAHAAQHHRDLGLVPQPLQAPFGGRPAAR